MLNSTFIAVLQEATTGLYNEQDESNWHLLTFWKITNVYLQFRYPCFHFGHKDKTDITNLARQ